MAIIAKDVLQRARIQLNDGESVYWPLPDLLLYLNDGVNEIALHKPNSVAKSAVIELEEGPLQTHAFYRLIRVIRNITSEEGVEPRVGGRIITPIERTILDTSYPGWQDDTILPYAPTVDHVSQDMMNPQEFYVVPGNDGTGRIEAVVAELPVPIVQPASPFAIESYDATVEMSDIYRNALTDYVLHRAYAKDNRDPNHANRSAAHYQLFAQAIGLKTAGDMKANVDAPETGVKR